MSVAQKGFQPALLQRLMAGALVRKETEFGDEADVSQRYIVADEEHPIRLQSLLNARGVGRQRLLRAGMGHGRDLGLAQGKGGEWRGVGEDKDRVEKTVDARCLVRISPVEREPLVPDPGDGAHDAVRLEDADPAVGAERGRASKSQSQSCTSRGKLPRTSPSTPQMRAAIVAFQIRGFGR